jgi:hypothetical protein
LSGVHDDWDENLFVNKHDAKLVNVINLCILSEIISETVECRSRDRENFTNS